MAADLEHPCLKCGACCAYFRVSFYWREGASGENPLGVPLDLAENYSDFQMCMKGTNEKHRARCVALEGRVGQGVSCSIYTLRPSPCRAFTASFEDGKRNPRCEEARAQYGLAPLCPHDWAVHVPRRAREEAPQALVENTPGA